MLRAEASTARCLRQGTYSKVCSIRGTTTPRHLIRGYLLRGGNSEVPTPKCLLRAAHSEVLASRIPTPSYLPRDVYSEVPTSGLLNLFLRLPTLRSLHPGPYIQETTPEPSPSSLRTPRLRQGQGVPRTPSPRSGYRVRAKEQDYAQEPTPWIKERDK